MGVLADFLEVEGQYEHVVDDFLRDELNFVVVKSWDAADYGMNLLRGDVDGTRDVPGSSRTTRRQSSFVQHGRSCDSGGGSANNTIVPLKNCIRVLDGFGKSLEVILPKLRDGYIVPDRRCGTRSGVGEPGRLLPGSRTASRSTT